MEITALQIQKQGEEQGLARSLFQVDYGIPGIKSRFRKVGLEWGNTLRIEGRALGNLQVKMKDRMRSNKDKRGSQSED